MPTNVVKTPEDEEKWQKAKAVAAAKGEGENYAYIMGVYKRMNPERFNKKARHVVAYHGSNVPIRRFDRSKAAMGVFWFSEDKGAVERGEKANRTDWLMTARLDVGDKIAGWEEYDKLGLYELERQFDSVKLDDDWIIFDPSKIKVTKTEKIDRGRRASPTRVAMRSKPHGGKVRL